MPKWAKATIGIVFLLLVCAASIYLSNRIGQNLSKTYRTLVLDCWNLGFMFGLLIVLIQLILRKELDKDINDKDKKIDAAFTEHIRNFINILRKKEKLLTRGTEIVHKFSETEDRESLKAFWAWKDQYEALKKESNEFAKENEKFEKLIGIGEKVVEKKK